MNNINYQVIRSDRKTLALEVTLQGEILVRAPKNTPEKTITDLGLNNRKWIEKTLIKQQKRREINPEPTENEIKELKAKAQTVLPQRVEYFSNLTGLKCTGIKITSAKTRLGSCNGKNSICFSYLLMRHSPEVIDYVVLHELAHTKHHNHGKQFWNLVKKYMPDYQVRRNLIKW